MGKKLDKFIEKYGEQQGIIKYNEAQEKISTGLKRSHAERKKLNPNASAESNPRSIYFYLKRGYTEADAKLELEKLYNQHSTKMKQNWQAGVFEGVLFSNMKEYWIVRGYSEAEAIEKVKKRQQTFSLDKCISNYGEVEGLLRFEARQKKWQNSLQGREDYTDIVHRRTKFLGGYSKISQELFWALYQEINHNKIYFAELNAEFCTNTKNGSFKYDFVDTKNKKCIEFNGDIWHANPDIYSNDYIHPHDKTLKCEDVWEKDKIKIDFLRQMGYNILVIWEKDYNEDKKTITDRCLQFLRN